MNDRIVKVRKEIGLTQDSFAEKIGLSKNFVWMIEKGERVPSERTINAICREFDVNKEWLLTGEGEMFKALTRSQTITNFMGDLVVDDNSFKARLIEALAKLDESEWETLEKIAKDIVQNGGS